MAILDPLSIRSSRHTQIFQALHAPVAARRRLTKASGVSRYSFAAASPFAEVIVGFEHGFYFAQVFKRSNSDQPFRWHQRIERLEALSELLARDGQTLPDAMRRQLDSDRTCAPVVCCPGDHVVIRYGPMLHVRATVLEVTPVRFEHELEPVTDPRGPAHKPDEDPPVIRVRLRLERPASLPAGLKPRIERPDEDYELEVISDDLALDMSVF